RDPRGRLRPWQAGCRPWGESFWHGPWGWLQPAEQWCPQWPAPRNSRCPRFQQQEWWSSVPSRKKSPERSGDFGNTEPLTQRLAAWAGGRGALAWRQWLPRQEQLRRGQLF